MKKFILIFIILFCFNKTYNAKTYYGEYFKVNNIDDLATDLIKVESYNLYNTYTIEYIDKGYLEENNNYIKDEEDYIIEENISDKEDIYEEIININTTLKNQRRIYISNISSNFKIYEIEIYFNDEKIEYKPTYSVEYNQMDIYNLSDNNYETYYENTTNDSSYYIALDLKKKYDLNNLKILIYTQSNDNMNFDILLEKNKNIELNNKVDRKHIISFNVLESKTTEDIINLYKNKNIKYKYYEEIKIPSNIYVKDGNNILLDDYITQTNFYKRNKLILKDDLIIKRKTENIKNLIEYSSSLTIIDCNINYEINNTYLCKFILDGLEIEKEIIVNIEQEKNEESIKRNLQNIKQELKIDSRETNNTKKEQINVENLIIDETKDTEFFSKKEITTEEKKKEQELEKKYNKVQEINNKNQNNKIEKQEKIYRTKIVTTKDIKTRTRTRTNNYKIKIIPIIILIIMNIFCILKRKRYNVESISKK